ncbi:hydantoinase/oxoprolinase family protein [Neobacillus niacini]|uniref:hydantoinase/oxoprolinase family protein n=1 Tax=Neobacillus niacini TaxID=86668 RepID=UPI0021CAE54D|nr:hydantoinase/oxoprolinase family protein [Neobacillus niacini]MCM3766221.1 hydantoinase/oxoprolinase family protein [Neobacillus niacini]
MSQLITIDNGGTFTDICLIKNERIIGSKVFTTPYDLTKCFIDVLKQGSKELYGEENLQKLFSETEYIRYSTTAGTNAIVQKKGPRLGLIVSEEIDIISIAENREEQDMFAAMVNNRYVHVNPIQEESILEKSVVQAVNELLSLGANRLVVSMSGQDLIAAERKIRKIILQKYPRHLLGAIPVLFSHEMTEDQNDKRRTWSALTNSFLHPSMEQFLYNAENVLRNARAKNPLLIFHNDGNSTRVAKTTAIKTYGSGPRGGMEGAKVMAQQYQIPAVLALDIGGTTSDVSLIQAEKVKEEIYGKIEGIKTSYRLGDLLSIGAGGSSIFKVQEKQVVVGPESVGAFPGPACFGRGGKEATITDANLLMGIFNPNSYFGGKMMLDEARASAAIDEKIANRLGVSLEQALLEMEKAYNQKIASGLQIYQKETKQVTLLAFGGAGPMSACGIAEEAGIEEVIVPQKAAVFSAFGISFSDIAHEYQIPFLHFTEGEVKEIIEDLMTKAKRDMFAEGFELSQCQIETSIGIIKNESLQLHPLSLIKEDIDIINNADEAHIHLKVVKPIDHYAFVNENKNADIKLVPIREQRILQSNNDWRNVPVYQFEDISPGSSGVGPALIEDSLFTCRVLEGWSFLVNENKDIFLRNERRKK